MKNISFLPLLCCGFFLLVGCSAKLMPEGHFQTKPVVVDGNISDWGLPLRFSNAEYTMQYSVTNDNRNIYVCVYSKDESLKKRILKAGMSICLDPKGEKDKKMSLVYPERKPDDPTENRAGNPIRYSENITNEEQLISQSDYYNTVGFLNLENGQFDVSYKQNDIHVAIRINEDSSLAYEASIPIRNIFGSDLQASQAARNLSVGIIVNTLHHNSGTNTNGYRPHSSYGGTGMRGMHGMGGGRSYNSNNSGASKPEENWYQFSLGYKKA
ncbi:MAG TPA: hypothetical protein VK772_13110 [Puia sp.]|nr:hypothetical protein [Puia sp.]